MIEDGVASVLTGKLEIKVGGVYHYQWKTWDHTRPVRVDGMSPDQITFTIGKYRRLFPFLSGYQGVLHPTTFGENLRLNRVDDPGPMRSVVVDAPHLGGE